MLQGRYRIPMAAFLVIVLLIATGDALADERAPRRFIRDLLNLGNVGPDAVNLKVWTNMPSDHIYQPGERVIIHFLPEKDCYVTVLNLSKSGEVAILFPNKENPDNRLRAGKEYTLFGSETGPKLTMAKGLDKSKIIFFVTKEPILKNFLKIQDGEFIMRFSIRDKIMNILYDRLKAASTQPGYNKVLLSIKGEPETQDLKLMGRPSTEKVPLKHKRSEPPETVTGTQGAKPEKMR